MAADLFLVVSLISLSKYLQRYFHWLTGWFLLFSSLSSISLCLSIVWWLSLVSLRSYNSLGLASYQDLSVFSQVGLCFSALFLYNTGGCPPPAVPVSQILHPTCSAYISLNNGRILMFKVSKWPYRSSQNDKVIFRWRHNPPGSENLNLTTLGENWVFAQFWSRFCAI